MDKIYSYKKLIQAGFTLFVSLLFSCNTIAQEHNSINSCGGDVIGSGGSASYTVGQPFYSYNSSSQHSASAGVQQAYEISSITTIPSTDGITFIVFPNPTSDKLVITSNSSQNPNSLSYQLIDINGKLIHSANIYNSTTNLDVKQLTPAVYYLLIFKNAKETQSFKIIKN